MVFNPNSQGGLAPSANFIAKSFDRYLPYGEWQIFLTELNFMLNSMMDFTNKSIYSNPNIPTANQLNLLNQMINNINLNVIGSGTDTYIARWKGTGAPVLQDSLILIDSSGNLLPNTTLLQNLGSSSLQWNDLITVQVEAIGAGNNLTLKSGVADIRIFPGTAGNFYVYDQLGGAGFKHFKSGSLDYFDIQNSVFVFDGSGTPGTPASGSIYVYKKTATANKIYLLGENGAEILLNLATNITGDGTISATGVMAVTSINGVAYNADPLTQYFLLTGRSGGQTAKGDTASGGNLILSSTAHATKGKIYLGTALANYIDEANGAFLQVTNSGNKGINIGTGATFPANPLVALGSNCSQAVAVFEDTGTTGRAGNFLRNNAGNTATCVVYGDGFGVSQLGVSVNGSFQLASIGAANMAVGTINAKPLTFATNNTMAITIDASQKVGINNASPGKALDVTGDIKLSGNIFASSNTSGKILIADGTKYVPTAVSGDGILSSSGVLTITGQNGSTQTLEGTSQRVFRSVLPSASAVSAVTSATAYFIYLGKTVSSITPQYVEFFSSAPGTNVTSVEIGLFSSPNPPNKSNQTLTKLATATVNTALGTNTVIRNTSAMSTAINAGTQLWAGILVSFSVASPNLGALSDDYNEGYVETLAGSGTFASTTSFAATIPTDSGFLSALAVDLRATLD